MHECRRRGYRWYMGSVDDNNRNGKPHRRTQLQIAPEFANLERVRQFITDEMLDDADTDDTLYLVAANELVTNAIETHRRAGIDEPITVSIDHDRRVLVVADLGEGYEPDDRGDPDRLAEFGRGLSIAEALSPGLWWEPNRPTGTIFNLPYPGT